MKFLILMVLALLLNASYIDTQALKKPKYLQPKADRKPLKAPSDLNKRKDASSLLIGAKSAPKIEMNLENSTTPSKILQKPADDPKDIPLEVIDNYDYTSCYYPMSTGFEGYVALWYCKYSPPARYDVFKRISFNVNGVNLCLTAPRGVIDGDMPWDYVRLRPCAINDEAQFWNYRDGGFHSKVGDYRLKDYKSYVFISKNPKDYNDHFLTINMKDWLNTIAKPATIAIKTQLYWFNSALPKEGLSAINVKNPKNADTSAIYYYYNVESTQFSTYVNDPNKGNEILCLASMSMPSHSWDYTTYESCTDFSSDRRLQWKLLFNGDSGVSFIDMNGKILRTQRYGPKWGVTYTADKDYIAGDTTYSPTSYFVLDQYFKKYFDFYHGNIAQNLEYCPAGVEASDKSLKQPMPTNYNFTNDWLDLFYRIGVSDTQAGAQERGYCGVCMLQSIEILYQLSNSYPTIPSDYGHFFRYERNRDPFIDLRSRHSLLHDTLFDIRSWFRPIYTGESIVQQTNRMALATLQSTLSNYDFTQRVFEGSADVDTAIETLATLPVGGLYLVSLVRTDPSGTMDGHAVVAVGTSSGVVIIQTNVYNLTLETFRQLLAPTRDRARIRTLLADTSTINGIILYQMTPLNPFVVPLDMGMTQRDCSGGGAGHRGSNSAINRNFINQCSHGRCDLPY